MKKAGMIFAVLTALAFASCSTTDVSTNKVGWSEYVDMAVKDFESMGVITLKSEEVVEISPLHIMKEHSGARITYSALFAEAVKLGADDIVNVRIDVQTQEKTTPFDWLIGSRTTHSYTGTALAVKYTTPVDRVKSGNLKEISAQNEKD